MRNRMRLIARRLRRAPPHQHRVPSELGDLFERAGSDKGRWYGPLYDMLLNPVRYSTRSVVEIGIGTMVPDAPSSMVDWSGEGYAPGASLKVWRDYFTQAEIHGVDPAPDTTVVGESRIQTHSFDSRDAERASEFLAGLSSPPDLIVDDGLHTAEAQVATLRNFLPAVRPGGLYVLEDIDLPNVRIITAEIDRLMPQAIYVPDCRPEPWIAIAIRVPR